ncbi:MAG: sodium:solute symporter [Prolixibacteraceae bacterium]|jgi:SSS family solute:Na+ symporter|nr:sodium:solute symporter [Prolixibacteraceae bacterium]
MQPIALLFIFISYFAILLFISYWIGRSDNVSSFYNGNRKSPWFVVAFGMVGATLSGVTFISVPGEVGTSSFHYFQFVLGNLVGYIIIAFFLIPYYYRKNILSIYTVLQDKMGNEGYLTTSGFFILSKIIGAAFRLYLAAIVLYLAIAQPLGISFGLTVLFCLTLIWLYTVKSGIKTVVWSDTIQTFVLIVAVVAAIISIYKQLGTTTSALFTEIIQQPNTKIFDFNWQSSNNFYKQFIAGIFMTIALNGFDQDIVQKNLTCKNSKKAQKNMLVFSAMFIATVFLFLVLGALLYYFAQTKGIAVPEKTDQLFPLIAMNHLGKVVIVLFILGISAAAFSSADSATTALTTAFSIDFIKIERFKKSTQVQIRNWIHVGFSVLIFVVIMLFYKTNNQSVVTAIFKAAGYTYGPILGVFVFSFFINRTPRRKLIVPICIVAPIFTFLITLLVQYFFNNYKFGFELIIINAVFTLGFLVLFSNKKSNVNIHKK